jgi:hypothetical protein
LFGHSIFSKHFIETEGSVADSKELSTCPYPSQTNQSTSPYPTSTRSILILSTHLGLGFPNGLLPPLAFPSTTYGLGPLSPQHGASSGCRWRNGLQLWRVAENILSSRGHTTRGGPPAWGLGVGLTTFHRKNKFVTQVIKEPRTLKDSLNMDSKSVKNEENKLRTEEGWSEGREGGR